MKNKYRLVALSLLFVSSLGACANSEREAIDIACPQVGIMNDLSSAKFHVAGEQKSMGNLIAEAKIVDYEGSCDYAKKGVSIDLKVSITVEKGPKLKKDVVKVKYFVAIANPQREILKKSVYETDIQFKKNQVMAGSLETLTQFIPLHPNEGAGGYEILFGFQPDDAVTQFNQSQ